MTLLRLSVRSIVGTLPGGSSRPLLVETDGGRFVLKLVNGPEGPFPLAAEWWCTGLARALGLPTLEIVALELDPRLADPIEESELREAVQRGAGLCQGIRELAGARAATLKELERAPDDFAIPLLWLDLLVENPDRRSVNPNILAFGSALFPIDHGAALSFHHTWDLDEQSPRENLGVPEDHVFASRAAALPAWYEELERRLSRDFLNELALTLPDEWLGPLRFGTPERQKLAYATYLWKRLKSLDPLGARARLLPRSS
jgi:hypothetical protein